MWIRCVGLGWRRKKDKASAQYHLDSKYAIGQGMPQDRADTVH